MPRASDPKTLEHPASERASRSGASGGSGGGAGKRTRTEGLTGRPATSAQRVAAAGADAESVLREANRVASELERAIAERDYERARSATELLAALCPPGQRAVRGPLARARQAGASVGLVAELERRAARLEQRLVALRPWMPAPAMPFDLFGLGEDAEERAAWLGKLDAKPSVAAPGGEDAAEELVDGERAASAPNLDEEAAEVEKDAGRGGLASNASASEPTVAPPQRDPWPVFAASKKPYLLETRNGRPGAWVIRDWVEAAAADRDERGISAPARAQELFAALGWVDAGRLDDAASKVRFRFTRTIEYLALDAAAIFATGLPPGVDALVDRGERGGLRVTLRPDDPALPQGSEHEMTPAEDERAFRAAADFTGLPLDPEGVRFLRTQALRRTFLINHGSLLAVWPAVVCQTLFGFDAYERWRGTRAAREPAAAPKLALSNYYERRIPGSLEHGGDIIESGEQVRFEVQVAWPAGAPNPAIYECPPMVTPGKQGNVALLKCSWHFERVDGGAAAAQRLPAQTTELAEVQQRLSLTEGELSATFRVRCEARFDEYFAPAVFTRDVQVLSCKAAMASLRMQAFGGLGASDAARGGSSWTGAASPELLAAPATSAAAADPGEAKRAAQHEQLEGMRDYLAASPSGAEAVAAIDRELLRRGQTEALLAQDRASGWQPFAVRGTYLSRTEGLPSGALDLHGSARFVPHYDRYAGDGPATTMRVRNDQHVVQLRDLSRRFESEDLTFTGRGASFDAALQAAFDDLAIAYPKGLLAIEAEQLGGAKGANGAGQLGARTGNVVGFQRSSETLWKKVKETAWDPVVSTVVNLGAIALMTLAPFTAPIVAPAILAYNAIPAVDQILSHHARGTLTAGRFATSAGEIALNLLPGLARARQFSAGWYAIETANWGGQVALMTAAAVDIASELQAQQVVALAAEYQALLELQQRSLPSDPGLAAAEAAIRRRAAAVSDSIAEQLLLQIRDNGIVMVTGSVVHNTSAHVRGAVIEHLGNGPRATSSANGEAPAVRGGAMPVGRGSSADDASAAASAPGDGGDAGPPRAEHGGAEGAPKASREGERELVMLLGADAKLRELVRNVPPLPGYIDVVIHGEIDSFIVMRTDVDIRIDQRAFAAYLRKHGLEGHKIRLIACESGKNLKGVAQHLSNQLNVEVLAPTDVVWVGTDGTMIVGGRRQRQTKEWEPFLPKASGKRSTELSPLAAEAREKPDMERPEDFKDNDVPRASAAAHRDERARATTVTEAELSKALGARVRFSASLSNGVDVKVRRVKKLLGFELEVTEVRVGRNAILADVVAHRATVVAVVQYNGVVGKLRQLAQRFAAWRRKQPRARFPHGSRGWQTQLELERLDALLQQRNGQVGRGTVDEVTLKEEIAFLKGRIEHHKDVMSDLEAMPPEEAGTGAAKNADAGEAAAAEPSLRGADVERSNEEALARGYRLPGAAEGVRSEWYYYRNSDKNPRELKLALRPTAPYDAPKIEARVISGEFFGFEKKPRDAAAAEIPYEWTPADVIEHLRKTRSYAKYAEMIEDSGLASREVVDGVANHVRHRMMTGGDPVTTEQVRSGVKDYFRRRLMEHLMDAQLNDASSWQRLRAMIEELPPDDRAAIAEDWYRSKHARKGEAHVPIGVERTSGAEAGKIEQRVVDIVEGSTAVEVKDIAGAIDAEQLGAYLDMLRGDLRTGMDGKSPPKIKRVKYVFTKPEGAIANLEMFADKLSNMEIKGRLSIEVFDRDGKRHVVTTETQARALLQHLSGKQGNPS